MHAQYAMTRQVIVVPPELSLRDAWEIMRSRRIRHLPVARAGTLIGILSDRDVLVRSALEGIEIVVPSSPVGEAMTPEPFVCEATTDVRELVQTMTERKIDAMPVVDGQERLIGLVTSTDLMLLLLDKDEARPLPFDFELVEHDTVARA